MYFGLFTVNQSRYSILKFNIMLELITLRKQLAKHSRQLIICKWIELLEPAQYELFQEEKIFPF